MKRWLPLLLLLTACVRIPLRATVAEPPRTCYSPGDGLVHLAVTTSTTSAVDPREVVVIFDEVDLDFRVAYRMSDPWLLIEPGRYRLAVVRTGQHYGVLTDATFDVQSGRVHVLPPLRVEGAASAPVLTFPATATTATPVATAGPAPWTDRPRVAVDWAHREPVVLYRRSWRFTGAFRMVTGGVITGSGSGGGSNDRRPPSRRTPR